jgi:hypothetical protein
LALAALLVSPACTRGGAAAVPAAVELPFEFRTRQPILQVRVNGAAAVPFVVDTGASIHLVDDAAASAAGLLGRDGSRLYGGGAASVATRNADNVTFETGGWRWEDQRATIVRLGYPQDKHFAGLLGAPILSRYALQFDFDRRVMRLLDPRAYRPPSGAVVVPFEIQEGLPVVRAMVDAGNGPFEARLMVDTGAGGVFVDLNRPFVDRHRLLDAIERELEMDRPAAIGGTAPFVYGRGKQVVLGGIPFERPRLGLSRSTTGSSSRAERDGIIGNLLLVQFQATFDYARRTLVLEEPSSSPRAAATGSSEPR